MKIPDVTDETFEEEVVRSPLPVMVDFYATWCGPCKAMLPGVEDMASEYEGEMIVRKIDIDANPGVRDRHGVRSVPTFLFFRDGEVIDSIVGGGMTRSALAARIERILEATR